MSREKRLPLKPIDGDPGMPRALLARDSPEWCYRTLERLRYTLEGIHLSESHYRDVIGELVEHRAWEKIPSPRDHYVSLDAMLKAEVGITAEEGRQQKVQQQAEAAKDVPLQVIGKGKSGPGRGNKTVDIVNRFDGGNSAEYLTARIARDRPDILDRMKAGEFTSVRKAAMEAGIIGETFLCPVEPEAAARRILARFSGEPLAELVRILAEAAGGEKKTGPRVPLQSPRGRGPESP